MNWSYIAGFFDGEGSIVKLRHTKGCYRISFAQGTKPVLESIKLFLDGYNIHSWITEKKPSKAYPKTKGYHLAFAATIGVKLFLENVIPYLIVKKEQAIQTIPLLTNEPNRHPTKGHYTAAKVLLGLGCSYDEVREIIGIRFSQQKLGELSGGRGLDCHKGKTWKVINGRRVWL